MNRIPQTRYEADLMRTARSKLLFSPAVQPLTPWECLSEPPGTISGTANGVRTSSESNLVEVSKYSQQENPAMQTRSMVPTLNAVLVERSQDATSTAPLKRTRSSLLFDGTLPKDWDQSQQNKLQWTIEEVARRLKIKASGPTRHAGGDGGSLAGQSESV
jgi:hypothetical protein